MAKKGGNPQNLIPVTKLTPEERRKRCSNGGKKRAENERKRMAMKEQLEMLLRMPVTSRDGINALLMNDIKDPALSDNQAALLVIAINKAMEGGLEFLEFIRDTIGEKPANNLQLDATATVQTISENDRKLLERVEKRLKTEQKQQKANETG